MAASDDGPSIGMEEFRQTLVEMQNIVGEYAVRFALLEDATTNAINSLLRLTETEGQILESIMRDFGSRIKLLHALITISSASTKLKLVGNKVCSILRSANSDRNNLLHDLWNGYYTDTKGLNKKRYIIKDNGELSDLDISDITLQLARDSVAYVGTCIYAVTDWRDRFILGELGDALPPLENMSYEGSPLHIHLRNRKKAKFQTPPPASRE